MAFSYKTSITIDHTKVQSTDQTDFPILISGTYAGAGGIPDLRSVGNSGKVQNSNGYDIQFFSDAGLTTRLPVERESYNATTGAVVFWVKKTVLTATDLVIYIGYGDSGISTDPNSDGTYGATSVWDSNFKGVWHLPNGTTLTALDSTGVNNGTVTGVTAGTGQIDGAGSFAGGTNKIDAGNNASVQITGAITMDSWVNWSVFPTSSSSTWQTIFSKSNGDFNNAAATGYGIVTYNSSGLIVSFGFGTNGTTGSGVTITTSDFTFALSTWYHIVGTWDGTTNANGMKVYINGVLKKQGTLAFTDMTDKGAVLHFGKLAGGFGVAHNGLIDETRISNSARSTDWITTEYNNQSSPSTFYTMGSETTLTSASQSPSASRSPSSSSSASRSPSTSISSSISASPSITILNTRLKIWTGSWDSYPIYMWDGSQWQEINLVDL